MLDHAGLYRCLWVVERQRNHHDLLAHLLLLDESYLRPPLSKQDGPMVFYRSIAYRHRPRNLGPTDAYSRFAATAAETEVLADADFCSWRLVYHPFDSSMTTTGLLLTSSCSVCLTSCLRLYHLYVLVKSNDLPWYNVQAAAWSSIEINVGIVCACLPTLRPLLKSAFPCLLLNASSRSGSQDPPSDRPPVNPDANHGVEVKPSTAPPHKPESVLLMKKETEKQGNSRGSRGLQEFELGILSMSTDSTSRGVTPMNSA